MSSRAETDDRQPLIEVEASVAPPARSNAESRFHVLLVEDDPAHAMVVRRALDGIDESLSVEHLDSGTEAVLRLERVGMRRPDLVLVDIKLPGMNGLDLLSRIKSDPDLMTVPVVVLTTSQSEHDRAEAFRRHANAYVLKPTNYDEFKRIARTLIGFWAGCNVTAYGPIAAE